MLVYTKTVPRCIWTITNEFDTENLLVQVYDQENVLIIPDRVQVGLGMIEIHFNRVTSGQALIFGSVLKRDDIEAEDKLVSVELPPDDLAPNG